jgi:hypothetical protein
MGFWDRFLNQGMKEKTGVTGKVTVKVRHWNPETETYGDWKYLAKDKPNLLTDGGRDFIHNQVWTNTSAGTRGAGFIALTENATAPADGDTTLTAEITTNGLARADAGTKTHTNGTNTTTIQHTFTASGAFTAVQKSGLFNASSSGILVNENTFTSTALATNDQLQVTWTITADD